MEPGHNGTPVLEGVVQPTPSTCLSACIATILGVPVHRTPAVNVGIGEAWFDRFNDELRDLLGYEMLSLDQEPVFRGFWIAVVPSLNRDAPGGHAVVMHSNELIWDPCRGEKYTEVPIDIVTHAIFLLPLHPKAHE